MPRCSARLLSAAMLGLASLACATSALGAQTVITSAGPLTSIYVNNDLGCSVDRASQTQVFGGTDPGSCGTFLAVGGSVYGPASVGPTTDELTPFSQTPTPTGSGTSGDPYEIVTIADAVEPGLRITQTDRYVVGNDFYTTDIDVSNGASQAVVLYHAADCFLRGDDGGVGYNLASNIYCSRGPSGAGVAAGVLGYEPLTAGASFMEGDFSSVFGAVNGTALPNTCDCLVVQDHGAGISWSFTATPGSHPFSFRTLVSKDTRPPQTTITDGPGSTSETTPTFSFEADEASATFECSVDGPAIPTAPCDGDLSHTTSPLGPGPHVFRVTATDSEGNQDASPATANFTVSAPAGRSGVVPTSPAQPKPVLGKTAVVGLVSGTVRVRTKGSKGFVKLTGDQLMPVGSIVDTKKGRVSMTMAAGGGKTNTAQFYDGLFQVLQAKAKNALAEMRLVGALEGCGKKAKGSSEVRAGAKKRSKIKGRRLRGTGKGRFRMRGKYSSAATAKSATWFVQDRCSKSTLTVVGSGLITVRDFAKRKTITVKKGKKYIAKARKRKPRR